MKLQRCGGCIDRGKAANKALFAARNGDIRGLVKHSQSFASSAKRDLGKAARFALTKFGSRKR